MKFRQLLREAQACINDNLTEEQLLDMEVKIVTEASSGQYKVNCGIKKVIVNQEMRYSNTRHELVPLEADGASYIVLETTMIP